MRVGIRVDASRAMSLGHLTRCQTLADALKERGANIVFLCAPSTAAWRDMVEARGHAIAILPLEPLAAAETSGAHDDRLPWGWRVDAEATVAALGAPADWLIVDHYALDARWEQAARGGAARIMVIDDLADRRHDCDLILDQNAQNAGEDRYAGLVPAAARRLIGPRYALLRPQFAAARDRVRDGGVDRILVFMSATDPKGATLMALEALSSERLAAIPVDVVIGAASPHLNAIRARAASRGRADVHVDAEKMAALCAAADVAIGAGGVAALERCCVGLPSLTLSLAANQTPGLAALGAAGAVRNLGRIEDWTVAGLADAVEAFIADKDARSAASKRAAELVDGRGAARCANAVLGPSISLRKATRNDARLLFDWRNDDSVRLVSLNAQPIAWSEHLEWLERKLRDPHHFHWIAESHGEPCGAARFDLVEGGARVSIVVAPGWRGGGIGGRLLAEAENKLIADRGEAVQVIAEILPGNDASRRLFEKSGYAPSGGGAANRLIYVKFARPGGA